MKPDARTVTEWPGAWQQLEHCVEPTGHFEPPRCGQRLAPTHLGHVDATKVHRSTLTGSRKRLFAAVHLHTAHLHPTTARQHDQLAVHADPARHLRPGDHGSESLHRKRAVDGEPGGTAFGSTRHISRGAREGGPQLGQPFSALGGHSHDRCAAEK